MDKIIIALGSGETDMPEIAQLSLKVKQAIKQLEKWPKLSNFFLKLFSRPEMRRPSAEEVKYLDALFDQILELFPAEILDKVPADEPQKVEIPLFELLLRYNFNHESVYRFYLDEIEDLVFANQDKAEQTLGMIRIHCEVRPRRDMAFNKEGNVLGEDLVAEIDRHFDLMNLSQNYFRPIEVAVHGNVFLPIVGLMTDAGLLKKPSGSEKFYQSLNKTFRGPDGKPFAIGTIRNRIWGDELSKLDDCKDILVAMMDKLDHKIKIQVRKQDNRGVERPVILN